MDVFIVYVPNTAWMRPYTTERKALAAQAVLERDGMVGHVLKTTMNQSEEDESQD